jgi:hypothetical protein
VHPLPGHVMQPETASVTNDLAMSRYDRVSPRWAKSRASISPYSNNKLAIVTLSPCWLFNLLSTSYMTNLKDFFAKKPSVTDNSGAVFPQPLSSTMNPQQLLSRSLLQSVHRVLLPTSRPVARARLKLKSRGAQWENGSCSLDCCNLTTPTPARLHINKEDTSRQWCRSRGGGYIPPIIWVHPPNILDCNFARKVVKNCQKQCNF